MQKVLTVLVLWGLFSCQQSSTNRLNKVTRDSVQPVRKLQSESAGAARAAYDSTIYQSYINPKLEAYLKRAHASWTWLSPKRWDTTWFNSYKTDSTLVNYAAGDFNCDRKKDYTAILKSNNGVIVAFAFLATGMNSFRTIKLEELGKDTGQLIDIGLDVLPEGVVDYIDPNDGDEPLTINVKCKSVQVLFFGKGARTYYWERGQLKSVTSGG